MAETIAKYLLEHKARVVILDFDKERLESKLVELKEFDDNITGHVCDVLDKSKVEKVSAKITAHLGKVDVLLNAAGGNMPGATIAEDQTIF